MPCGDLEYRVHLARDACVVHGHDGAGARGDGRLELALVKVHRIGADVDEYGNGAAEHECVRG